MVKAKTVSETLFEQFCSQNGIDCHKIEETTTPTPDYRITLNNRPVFVELKQIDADEEWVEHEDGTFEGKRIPGQHIRKKIELARKQIQAAAKEGYPAILLVYNNLDGMQMFGTELHDFISGMYGQLTVSLNIDRDRKARTFQGKNKAFSKTTNTSFSAVGLLAQTRDGATVHIYENMYARNKIDYSILPTCITWNKTTISQE